MKNVVRWTAGLAAALAMVLGQATAASAVYDGQQVALGPNAWIVVSDVTTSQICGEVGVQVQSGSANLVMGRSYLGQTVGSYSAPAEVLVDGGWTIATRTDCWAVPSSTGRVSAVIAFSVDGAPQAASAILDASRAIATRVGFYPGAAQVCADDSLRMRGALYGPDGGITDAKVVVQYRPGPKKQWSPMKVLTTGTDGNYSGRVRVSHTGQWRVKFGGADQEPYTYLASASKTYKVMALNCT